jgi:hypothetical protein
MIQHPPRTKHVGDGSEGFLFASPLRSFEPEGWWAASSRVRYLTAVAFLPKRGCWHRSGLWPDQSSFWLNQGYIRTITADPTADRRRHRFPTMEYYGNEGLGANSHSLLCNGWRLIDRVKGQNRNSDRERATATRWHSDKSYTPDFLHSLVRQFLIAPTHLRSQLRIRSFYFRFGNGQTLTARVFHGMQTEGTLLLRLSWQGLFQTSNRII